MKCTNCGHEIPLCPDCGDICEKCHTAIDYSESSKILKKSNCEYPDVHKNKLFTKAKQNQPPNRTKLPYKWEEIFKRHVLKEDIKGTYKTVNEALSDITSFPDLEDIPEQEKRSYPENG